MNDEAVCRTAPATPGLSITHFTPANYSHQWRLNTAQCTLLQTTHWKMGPKLCILDIAQCTIHNPQYTMHNAQCTIHNPQYTMHNAQSPMHMPEHCTLFAQLNSHIFSLEDRDPRDCFSNKRLIVIKMLGI